uniref:Chromosome 2 open reading frame 69 n=1 Tax=Paramormyrops kingsleyae TaxID=1676925 RepID=A0A3B3SN09_9TELE|nr:UPF0565 protein C2orf69 homolog isoform X1 [Paramormyrops kingsleyae]
MSDIWLLTAGVSLMVTVRTMTATAGSFGGAGLGVAVAPHLLRLAAVPGSQPRRTNDLLMLRPACAQDQRSSEDQSRHVVFFPGDIQNFEQEMARQAEGAQWQRWSFERVALILAQRFPGHYIWVVRAACMYLHKFSSYCNFVESNMFGTPEHSPHYGAICHLRALLRHGLLRAGLLSPTDAFPPPGLSLILVGFSKGCVVLNQIVHELEAAGSDPELATFLQQVSELYWLDGGHPGGSGTWVTERRALEVLAARGVALHAHVTPYEVQDPMRAWVGHEHRQFVETLKELKARVTSTLHFHDEPASIDNHFRVIEEF